ncbi:MAG: hypothetical protein COY72_00570 [Candidatus Nealsonbacteria bacterium CG_4_10_14_0_8_um_filter_35_10]|uniref:DUF6922 domain-containing protein n=2 Tax=Candidatus Nealsoniibacteriota TaxID=1817911 RepID=A0A2M7R8U7_9BACT|nr:MAG: hypothetical protein AUJ24_01380 [Parcubacteria group bacterium CG1_02_36_42]PIY90973.1 MAG: hypothetical protein COY72_00570 [Candidatus Nealsonbacteria bacterium CG_4_10_14_0_8_um_filter_35_10]PJB99343.1 MAG: hypothetical protein CO077_02270 [Candidatus Nealsonbacteria bacterium CG_4_9_14_0_8_um_filter_35_12]
MNKIKEKQNFKKTFPRIPENWQGILWSCNIKKLDWEKDKNYIIHQVLMYGDLNDIALLFKIYSKKEMREVFKKKPMKIYTPQTFNFIKKIILGIRDKSLSPEKYVKTLY